MEYDVWVYGIRLEHVLEFEYLGYVLDESGMDKVKCIKKGDKWKEGSRCH